MATYGTAALPTLPRKTISFIPSPQEKVWDYYALLRTLNENKQHINAFGS
jgi:hypothetical protein